MSNCDEQEGSLMALDQYLSVVRRIACLTPEEEAELVQCVERGKAERASSCPDPQVLADAREARNRLVEAFQPLVLALATRWKSYFRRMELLDLVQEGTLAVMMAVERNDPARGYRLAPLVRRCVQEALWRLWCEHDSLVRLPHHVQLVIGRLHRVEQLLTQVLGRAPSLAEIASEMGVSEAWLREQVEHRERTQVTSWERLVDESGDDPDACCALVPPGEGQEAGETLSPQVVEVVRVALETVLSPRQREVIERRFGFQGGYQTQEAVAEVLGIRRNGLQTTERRAKARLRAALTPYYERGQVKVVD
jgi:RNA polymerase sigma factor (sigma-70 family)